MIALEDVLAADEQPEVYDMKHEGRLVRVRRLDAATAEILCLLSPLACDYLDPRFQPGCRIRLPLGLS